MGDTVNAWQCGVCGYVHRGGEPPDECPICGADESDFEAYADPDAASISAETTRWRCLNCAYVHNGDAPPETCPVCGAPRDRFEAIVVEESSSSQSSFDGRVVVVGAGIAGVSAVEAIRKSTTGGSVTLVSKEEMTPYYRLNLTRYLGDEVTDDDLPIHPESWFVERDVDLRLGREMSELAGGEKAVVLNDGEKLPYDKLILCMGAHPFVPPIEGAHLEGVTTLRTMPQARALKNAIKAGRQCVCVGGGLLGLEIAGALTRLDADVTLLEAHDWLMPRQLNRRAAEILRDHVLSIGVKILYNARTKAMKGEGKLAEVELEDERRIPGELAVVCTGVRGNTHLARRAGLSVDRGIVVDDFLRTSNPDIYAAGDVAEHLGVLYGNWNAAQSQGGIAGMNAVGRNMEFGGIPRSNTLKALGLDLMSVGEFEPKDGSYRVVEDERDGVYHRFVFREGRMVGSVLVGDASAAGPIKQAIQDDRDFTREIAAKITVAGLLDELRA